MILNFDEFQKVNQSGSELNNIRIKNLNIFKKKNKKQIALTKNNDLGFLKKFNLPKIKKRSTKNKNWKT